MDQEKFLDFMVRLLIIFLILPVHEYAHAWMAYKLGDDTASYQGRLTLNPLAHLDIFGGICLLLTGFGWAKPVPVDPLRFHRKHSMRFGMAATAIAGPLSNLIVAFIGTIIIRIYSITPYYTEYLRDTYLYDAAEFSYTDAPLLIYHFIAAFISINIGLAVFNLLPIPPLDGSKVVAYFTGPKVERWFNQNAQLVNIIFICLLATRILTFPLSIVSGLIEGGMYFITSWIPMLFG